MINTNPRLRTCAVCIKNNSVLLVKHKRFLNNTYFPENAWILPGGRLEMGETMKEGAARELFEETGLHGKIGKMIFIKELVFPFSYKEEDSPLIAHNISIGFQCDIIGGKLTKGTDPERGENQLITEVKWMPLEDLSRCEIYPPFLTCFLLEVAKNGFEDIKIPYFESRE